LKKILVSIIITALFIGTTGLVTADWDIDDGHKMHYPQLPDPYGFDIDFGYWELADDWKCTESGPVDDIHFWISWFDDDPRYIDWIKVSIWSNEPNGPQGYSIPKELLWDRTFLPDQFIEAGPWDGQQRWFMPWGEIIEEYHYHYWQINIPEIDDPFPQVEGEIYWLVIDMPFDYEFLVGWKNTKDYFMDHAVWRPPGAEWMMIDGIDFAFVITGGTQPVPLIGCNGSLKWKDIDPGGTVTGTFGVGNIGAPGSSLNWYISSDPGFGTWVFSPSSGTGLAAGSWVTVTATCTAPNVASTTYTGDIIATNQDDSSDYCKVSVSLTTPRTRNIYLEEFVQFLEDLFHRFPILEKIITSFIA
jgi:hypothetical protein